MSRGVQDSHDHDGFFRLLHTVDDPIRKTLRVAPADMPHVMPSRIQKRVFRKCRKNLGHGRDKLPSQPGTPGIVPRCGFVKVRANLRAHHHAPVHKA